MGRHRGFPSCRASQCRREVRKVVRRHADIVKQSPMHLPTLPRNKTNSLDTPALALAPWLACPARLLPDSLKPPTVSARRRWVRPSRSMAMCRLCDQDGVRRLIASFRSNITTECSNSTGSCTSDFAVPHGMWWISRAEISSPAMPSPCERGRGRARRRGTVRCRLLEPLLHAVLHHFWGACPRATSAVLSTRSRKRWKSEVPRPRSFARIPRCGRCCRLQAGRSRCGPRVDSGSAPRSFPTRCNMSQPIRHGQVAGALHVGDWPQAVQHLLSAEALNLGIVELERGRRIARLQPRLSTSWSAKMIARPQQRTPHCTQRRGTAQRNSADSSRWAGNSTSTPWVSRVTMRTSRFICGSGRARCSAGRAADGFPAVTRVASLRRRLGRHRRERSSLSQEATRSSEALCGERATNGGGIGLHAHASGPEAAGHVQFRTTMGHWIFPRRMPNSLQPRRGMPWADGPAWNPPDVLR